MNVALERRKVIQPEAFKKAFLNNQKSATHATSVTITPEADEVIFVTGIYCDTVTAISEGGTTIGGKGMTGSFPKPHRFDAAVVVTGTNITVIYFTVKVFTK